MPQSQMANVPQIPNMSPDVSTFSPVSASASVAQDFQSPPAPSGESDAFVQDGGVGSVPVAAPSTSPSGSKTKTIFMIVGAILVALALGLGAYYLVGALVSAPATSVPVVTSSTEQLAASSSPSQEQVQAPTIVQPMAHLSLILAPAQTVTVTLPAGGPDAVRAAVVAMAGTEGLSVGSVKDITIVDASNTPAQSPTILSSYFPSFGQSLASMVDPDFTSWFYFDKTGGAKLGFVFKLNASGAQATTTIGQYIESNPVDVGHLFISTTTVPQMPAFKDGLVGNVVHVRYLVYNSKVGRVFEYGFMSGSDGSLYLILATSYNQIVDIVNRLKANPLVVPPLVIPSTITTSSTSSTP